MYILKVEVNNSYFLSSILKPITCHTGIFAGFLIISASVVCFQLILSLLPTKATEATALSVYFEFFASDFIDISDSGLPRQYA